MLVVFLANVWIKIILHKCLKNSDDEDISFFSCVLTNIICLTDTLTLIGGKKWITE